MSKICVGSVLLVTLLAVSAPKADAALITDWNFNNATSTATLFTPSFGSGTMSSSFAAANITDFTGTTVNAANGDVAGKDLALQDGTVTGTTSANNGANLTFGTSTVGSQSIMVSFAIQASATGFQTDQFQYTTDGTTYTNFGSTFTPPISYATAGSVQTFDLSAITALNNNVNAGFRIVFTLVGTAAPSSSGNNRIDNLQINGSAIGATSVPEPASMVMVGLGLVGTMVVARRRKSA